MAPRKLRNWQVSATAQYESLGSRDFLTTATPGAGKTTFGLHIAGKLLSNRTAQKIIVVTPTDHLRAQWADAAQELGIKLDPTLPNSVTPITDGFDGYVATYAQVAARPAVHRRRTEAGKAVVILDEIHHCADGGSSWGDAVQESFEPARRRIALTGTPFRTNDYERIPFVQYDEIGDGALESVADYEYGYRAALSDGVVRPVVFAAYTGVARWMTSAGEVVSGELGTGSKKDETSAWRTALDPKGRWIPHVIAAADQRLTDMRAAGMPDAGALLLASDQDTARAYANIVARVTGDEPVIVLSDDPKATHKLAAFADSQDRWVVAVQMISEGVDIPRLGVLVWGTAYRTPLFFAQAVGRVLRARHPGEAATVFLPAVRPLLALAASLEEQRNHVLSPPPVTEDEVEIGELLAESSERLSSEITAVDADASFAHLLHDGQAIRPKADADSMAQAQPVPEDEDYLGLPGLLTPEQTAQLLSSRDAAAKKAAGPLALADPPTSQVNEDWRSRQELRRELNRLVSALAARTKSTHGKIHLRVRQAVPGPPSASADARVLAARCDYLEQQL
ncbi:MAG: DEAD/DEAH box helicase family protein [Actinomycetia bacterium]|nr:DEAD/DEAH box helicase family protein [Actinomycetes bacterium]